MNRSPGIDLAGEQLAESDPVLYKNNESRNIGREGEMVEEKAQQEHETRVVNQVNG